MPVFLTVMVVLVVVPSTCVVEIDDGVTLSWPAPREKLAWVEAPLVTLTAWVAVW